MTTDVVLTLDETGSPARWRSPGARALRSLLKKKIACVAIVYLTIFYGAGLFAPLVVQPWACRRPTNRTARSERCARRTFSMRGGISLRMKWWSA